MTQNLYKVVWDDLEDGLLYGISIVDKPANKYQTLELSQTKQPIKLQIQDKKKKQLAGVVLIPNQIINRYSDTLGEYQVIFEKDTISKLAHSFFDSNYHKNSWYNHDKQERVEGTKVIESWVTVDEDKDKAAALGFEDLPEGTWMILMQLSDQAWEKYVESGKVGGFSIDSIMSLEKMELKESNLINKQEISMKNYVKQFIKMLEEHSDEEKETMEMMKLDTPQGELEVESLEEGAMVSHNGEPFSNSSFMHEGVMYETNEEGKISGMMGVEEMKEDLYTMIDKDEDLKMALKEKYSMSEKEVLDMAVTSAKENKEVRSTFRELFLEEINQKQVEVDRLKHEVMNLKAKLDETPSTGRLKANTDLSATPEKKLTGLSKIREVINKNK